jgi:hypothetical protein
MRPKDLAVEVIAKAGIESKAIAIDTDNRHSLSESALHVRPASEEVDWPVECANGNACATVARRNAVTK